MATVSSVISEGATVRPAGAAYPRIDWAGFARRYWFLLVAAAVLAIPALVQLGQIVWSTEQGAHGPIILTTGLWLLLREVPGALSARRPGAARWAGPLIGVALIGYVLAAMIGIVWLRWAAVYVVLVTAFYLYVGAAVLRRLWFPLFYLLFLVPPPYEIILALTRTLKLWISTAAVDVLSVAGFQVASSGTTLYIDQYELLVAAACSGMNSLVSLMAIGLFYIYLRHQADWRYAALLSLLVIPIAIGANLLRVIILLLVTKYLGNEVAQGILHEAAGFTMFACALLLLIACDAALAPLRRRLGRRAAA